MTTVDAAGQEFGVNLVLVLTVQRDADSVRVNYSLVDARSHQQARGGSVTPPQPIPSPFRIKSSKASQRPWSFNWRHRRSNRRRHDHPAAYDFYVQGRGYLQDYVVPEKVEAAITLFRRALEKDPTYADATAGLGEAFWRKYQLTTTRSGPMPPSPIARRPPISNRISYPHIPVLARLSREREL